MSFISWLTKPRDYSNPQKYWNWRGKSYSSERSRQEEFSENYRETYAFLDRWLSTRKYETLHDVGCGYGRLFPLWEQHDLKFHGIDFSASMAKKANESYPDTVTVADITRPVERPAADISVVSEVFLHIPPTRIADAIETVKRLTRQTIVIIDIQTTEPLQDHVFSHDFESLMHGWTLAESVKMPVGSTMLQVWEKNPQPT